MPIRMKGFTLIELMIVIVVIAVLGSIAVPSYRSYILRTHRVEATSALLNLAAAQEKFYLQNNTYAADDDLTDAPPAGLGLPETTENGWYTLEITAADVTNFTATATAAGGQVADSACASFTVNALGVKSATKQGGAASTDCWD
jgi:type IV pilus assembly protein PilE